MWRDWYIAMATRGERGILIVSIDSLARMSSNPFFDFVMQRIDEVINDPQIQARGMVLEQQHPRYGTLRLPNLPFRFSDCDTTAPMKQVAPDMGQHNAQIARTLGYSEADIQAMQADGVLFSK